MTVMTVDRCWRRSTPRGPTVARRQRPIYAAAQQAALDRIIANPAVPNAKATLEPVER